MKDRRCCWPGCEAMVPPSMWGCRAHWFTLPRALRARILGAYRPGQEVDRRLSPRYLTAFREAEAFAREWEVKRAAREMAAARRGGLFE